jgi:hypothetical protein
MKPIKAFSVEFSKSVLGVSFMNTGQKPFYRLVRKVTNGAGALIGVFK